MAYLSLKLLHIASVVLFLGNIVTGFFWAAHATRSRDFPIIASTFEGIIRSDRIFTTPGVLGILASGIAAAVLGGFPLLGTGWILWPIILFALSGAVFGIRIAPLQRRLAALAQGSANTEQTWREYEALYGKWKTSALVAIGTPVVALAIMVLKPSIPAP